MIDQINSSYSIRNTIDQADIKKDDNKNNISFSDMMKDNIDKVNNLQIKSDQITEDFAMGKIDNIHDVTIAAEKAKMAMNLTLAIHGKVVDAYNKLMRMQV